MKRMSFMIATLMLIIDQVSKNIIDAYLSLNETVPVVSGFFSLTNVSNTGAAFSILEGNTWLITILSVIIMIILFKMSKEFSYEFRNVLAFGLLYGGICGNFADRLFLGMVRDFLKFNIFGYNFPVFNLADICIVLGVVLLGISILKGDDRLENNS